MQVTKRHEAVYNPILCNCDISFISTQSTSLVRTKARKMDLDAGMQGYFWLNKFDWQVARPTGNPLDRLALVTTMRRVYFAGVQWLPR